MSGMANTSVKRMARHLFRMTRDLAEKDRIEVNEKIKHHFRNNLMGSREERNKLLKEAMSKISYLKILTPNRMLNKKSSGTATPKRFVYSQSGAREGRGRVEEKAKYSPYTGSNLDPEAVARHVKLVRRQHFMDRH